MSICLETLCWKDVLTKFKSDGRGGGWNKKNNNPDRYKDAARDQ